VQKVRFVNVEQRNDFLFLTKKAKQFSSFDCLQCHEQPCHLYETFSRWGSEQMLNNLPQLCLENVYTFLMYTSGVRLRRNWLLNTNNLRCVSKRCSAVYKKCFHQIVRHNAAKVIQRAYRHLLQDRTQVSGATAASSTDLSLSASGILPQNRSAPFQIAKVRNQWLNRHERLVTFSIRQPVARKAVFNIVKSADWLRLVRIMTKDAIIVRIDIKIGHITIKSVQFPEPVSHWQMFLHIPLLLCLFQSVRIELLLDAENTPTLGTNVHCNAEYCLFDNNVRQQFFNRPASYSTNHIFINGLLAVL